MRREEDFLFQQVREWSPQWRVLLGDKEVATVTQRLVKEPAYAVVIDGKESAFEDREQVMKFLVESFD